MNATTKQQRKMSQKSCTLGGSCFYYFFAAARTTLFAGRILQQHTFCSTSLQATQITMSTQQPGQTLYIHTILEIPYPTTIDLNSSWKITRIHGSSRESNNSNSTHSKHNNLYHISRCYTKTKNNIQISSLERLPFGHVKNLF